MKRLLILNKYILKSTFLIFLCSSFLITKPISDKYLGSMLDEEITANESFKVFIDSIIKKALLQEEEHLLSQGLLNCYERYSQNEDCITMHLSDLINALPELLKELDNQLKAPRPINTSNNAIVGPITCDLSQVLAFLEMLKAKIDFCCKQQLDCCAELIADFQQTWTILANISTITASVDLSPIFTTINAGFNGTFSALEACCNNINQEFQETWTILNAGFNGTFSAINAINAESSGTFSTLQDIKNTITACCENITNEFQQTWTILAAGFNDTFSSLQDIKNTLTNCCANFNGTYSVLADLKATLSTDFNQTWTILTAGFNGTFSTLQDIKGSLTACCANINNEFQQTWTILTAGFNGTFTVLANLSVTCSGSSGGQGFTSIFGDTIVEDRYDQVSNLFEYGVTNYNITTSTFSSGLVQSFTSMAVISSGTGATAFAQIQSKNYLKYMAGHDGYAFFSAMWPNGSAAGSTQWIGAFDGNDGIAVGFNGTTFSLLFRQNAVDTTIPQSSFNKDKLNGTGSSGFVLTTTDLNVFRIDYGWTGGTQINLQILGTTGTWITFHQINNTNVNPNPSFGNPILPMTAQVTKTSGATNVTIATAGWNAGIIAEQSVAQSRFFTAGQLTETSLTVMSESFVFAIQNKLIYQGKPNKVIVRISFVSAGVGNTGNTVTEFRLVKNATLTGTSFTDVDTANSVVQVSTTGVYTLTTGTQIFMFLNTDFKPFNNFIPEEDLTLFLYPGDTLSIIGRPIEGGSQTALAIMAWEERF